MFVNILVKHEAQLKALSNRAGRYIISSGKAGSFISGKPPSLIFKWSGTIVCDISSSPIFKQSSVGQHSELCDQIFCHTVIFTHAWLNFACNIQSFQ